MKRRPLTRGQRGAHGRRRLGGRRAADSEIRTPLLRPFLPARWKGRAARAATGAPDDCINVMPFITTLLSAR